MFFIHANINVVVTLILLVLICFKIDANEASLPSSHLPLSFKKTIYLAQQFDPWLTGNIYEQRSIEFESVAVNTLPDPKISIDFINTPTDGFDFNQEGMTQTKVGIAQVFPRGDSLAIKKKQLLAKSQAYPYQRKDREAKVAVTVGSLWLDLYKVEQSIALIEKHGAIFKQLIDITDINYSSAVEKVRQQDIVSAELELTRLEERLDKLAQQKKHYEGILFQWLTTLPITDSSPKTSILYHDVSVKDLIISDQLPQIVLLNENIVTSKIWLASKVLVHYFINHPAMTAIDKKIYSTKLGIKLAKQKYKPEWEVNASYGHRRDDDFGNSRADLLSLGVTFDVPLFTKNKQDKYVQSAVSYAESIKVEKYLLLREFLGTYSSAKGSLHRLKRRQALYKQKLIPQVNAQAEALLIAYTNDNGDFSSVVRSHLSVLNAEIDELSINIDEQKLHLKLNYLFTGNELSVKQSIHQHTISSNTNVGNNKNIHKGYEFLTLQGNNNE